MQYFERHGLSSSGSYKETISVESSINDIPAPSPPAHPGTAEPGGLGGALAPPTFEEDDILFCFSICSYSRKYIRVFAR